MLGSGNTVRPLYPTLLFAVCSSPLLVVRRFNDRYASYSFFLLVYFVSFGALDCIALATGKAVAGPSGGVLSESELVILAGGIAFVVGYLWASSRTHAGPDSQMLLDDWPMVTLVLVGLTLWAAGTFASLYWSLKLTVRSGEFHNDTGGLMTSLLMIGRYVQPLGLLIIAYAYVTSRSKALLLMTITVVCCQVVIGFVSNTKEGAMIGGILVILTSVLVTGRIPKIWLLSGIAFVVFAFPVFQAYRAIVIGDRGMSNAEAAQNLGKALKLSLENEKLVASDFGGSEEYHSQSFFERSSVKGSIDMIVSRTGVDVPYQRGHTLLPLALAFIPRLLWQDKLDVQTGQLVNQQFQVTGDSITYISPSHLGDLYWNFGWPGALVGMLLIGLTLGRINAACDLSGGASVTRLLIIAVGVYELCARFEGSISSEYPVWLRSIAGILLLHWLFARRGLRRPVSATATGVAATGRPTVSVDAPAVPFPNLLR